MVSIGPDNDFLPDGAKQLPEPKLTSHSSGFVPFTGQQFHNDRQATIIEFENYTSKITITPSSGQFSQPHMQHFHYLPPGSLHALGAF